MNRRWVPRAIGLPLLLLMGVAYPQAQPEQAAAPPAQASQTAAVGGAGNTESLLRRLS